jgi:hypothetical protein
MYNEFDVKMAQERYLEWVRAAELAATYERDESGASPARTTFKDKLATWKESVAGSLLVGRKETYSRSR